ncbi:MAG: hypothetical protein CME26_00525 [Gemmatimonadetes bacterium]|nr:hypothetical protein [Gemmatimonadota bacterium]|tara:strand:- start:3192 stop:4745 length:1554 start_codon:yes stop_codon:yes gene_type:complete
MDWDDLLRSAWPQARARHLYPEMPEPSMTDGDESVAIDARAKQIRLSTSFADSVAETVPPEAVVNALLDHGIAHHTVCPWDYDTYLGLYASLKPIVKDGAMIRRVLDLFTDVVVDTHCVRDHDSALPDIYARRPGEGGYEVIRSLYERLWGVELGVEEDAAREAAVSRLSRIPYLDRMEWKDSVRAFASVMTPFLRETSEDGPGDGEGGMLGGHDSQHSAAEIEKALASFAEQGYYAFRAMVDDFRDVLEDAGVMPEKGIGQGRGEPTQADLLYYMKRCERYGLTIRQTRMERVGGLYPHAHAPWEIGRPVQDIDIWTSFGKIMPGVSQVWERREGETHGTESGTPDCVLVVDSSGSMTNPCEELSFAVLGAGCAADAYLKRGRRVAVYNFSDAPSGGKLWIDYTRDRTEIFRGLCRYFGGGTEIDTKDFAVITNSNTDYFLITDMQISNLQSVTDYLSRVEGRVTAVHVGRMQEAEQFRKATTGDGHIVVYPVETPEDIPAIVIAEAESRFDTAWG